MQSTPESENVASLHFFKGKQDILEAKDGSTLEWQDAASRIREQLNDAMNAQHLGFLFGSGCSSLVSEGAECGIPTMAPLANAFIKATGSSSVAPHLDAAEAKILKDTLGIDLESKEYESNLERLLEVLHSLRFVLGHSSSPALLESLPTVTSAIAKVTSYILYACSNGPFAKDNDSVVNIYQAFYRIAELAIS